MEVGDGLGDGAKGKIIGTLENIKIKKNPVARKKCHYSNEHSLHLFYFLITKKM